jgi:hypothetical protein
VVLASALAREARAGKFSCTNRASCSDHGDCVNGACVCDKGWSGATCATACCTNRASCSDHGDCVNGACVCYKGWSGATCATAVPTPPPTPYHPTPPPTPAPLTSLAGFVWNDGASPTIARTNFTWGSEVSAVSCAKGAAVPCAEPQCRASFGRGTVSPEYADTAMFEMGALFPAAGSLVTRYPNGSLASAASVDGYLYGLGNTCEGGCSIGQSIQHTLCPYVAVQVQGSVESAPSLVCVLANGKTFGAQPLPAEYGLVTSGPWPSHVRNPFAAPKNAGGNCVLASGPTDSAIFCLNLHDKEVGVSLTTTLSEFHFSAPAAEWGKIANNPIVSLIGEDLSWHPGTGVTGQLLVLAARGGEVVPGPGGEALGRRTGLYVAAVSVVANKTTLLHLADVPGFLASTPDQPNMGSFGFSFLDGPGSAVLAVLIPEKDVAGNSLVRIELGNSTDAAVQAWDWPSECRTDWLLCPNVYQ